MGKSFNTNLLRKDFRYFQKACHRAMGLPAPSRMQSLIGDILQKSTARKLCILGYRGLAKTLESVLYVLWELYKDPTLQIKVWAANQALAADSTQMMLRCIQDIPFLMHMAPTGDMDRSVLSFDVQGRGLFVGSSVAAYGIQGGVTGTRADILIIDDPETSVNGETVKKRVAIDRSMSEAVNVIKDGGRIIVLGTVHFEDSLYLRLLEKGYKMHLFPIEVPSEKTQELCWLYYPEALRRFMKPTERPPVAPGTPLDRFSASEIALKRSEGLLNFERQFLVNPFSTHLSRKPFNLSKLIVFNATKTELPIRFQHTADPQYLDEGAMEHSSAMLRDKLYRPYQWDSNTKPYDRKILYVDPAGSGADETAMVVLGVSSGYAVILHVEGLAGGSGERENQLKIIEVAKRFEVDEICIEDNFGQGLLAQLLRQTWWSEHMGWNHSMRTIPITEHTSRIKKSVKILQTIDAVLNSGRLIMTPEALLSDYESALVHSAENRVTYRLTHQLSYFSESGRELEHDDRIDALASALHVLKEYLIFHPENHAETWEDKLIRKVFAKDAAEFVDKPLTAAEVMLYDRGGGGWLESRQGLHNRLRKQRVGRKSRG